jgi:hypothetical protein
MGTFFIIILFIFIGGALLSNQENKEFAKNKKIIMDAGWPEDVAEVGAMDALLP